MIQSPISNNTCEEVFECSDHLVSSEKFKILLDKETELMLTYPQPEESVISKYYESEEYNSHSDRPISFFDKVYDFVKGINIKSKYSVVSSKLNSDSKILDIGCGAGDFLNYCANMGWSINGIEPSLKANQISEKKLGMKISNETTLKSIPDNSYDVITMWHVLEHRYDIDETIVELKRIAKKDALIVIALPNYKSYDAKYYEQYWAAYDVPRHLFHFTTNTIKFLCSKHKLSLSKTLPMYFDSFYVSMLSEKNKFSKINIFRAFFVGLWSNILSLFNNEASSLIYVLKKK